MFYFSLTCLKPLYHICWSIIYWVTIVKAYCLRKYGITNILGNLVEKLTTNIRGEQQSYSQLATATCDTPAVAL